MLFKRYEVILLTLSAAGSALPYNNPEELHTRSFSGISDLSPPGILARDFHIANSWPQLTIRGLQGSIDDEAGLAKRGPCLSKKGCRSSDSGSQNVAERPRPSTSNANKQIVAASISNITPPETIPRTDSGHLQRQLAAIRRTKSASSSGTGTRPENALELTRSQSLGSEARDHVPPLQSMNSIGSRVSYPTTPGNSRPGSATQSEAKAPSTRSSRPSSRRSSSSGYQDSIGMLYGDPPPRRRRWQNMPRAQPIQPAADLPSSPASPTIPVWRGGSDAGRSPSLDPQSPAYPDLAKMGHQERPQSAESIPMLSYPVQKRSIEERLVRRGCFGGGCFGKFGTRGSGSGEASSRSTTKNKGKKSSPQQTSIHTQLSLDLEDRRRSRLGQSSQRRLNMANVSGRLNAERTGSQAADHKKEVMETQRAKYYGTSKESSQGPTNMDARTGPRRSSVSGTRQNGEQKPEPQTNVGKLFPQGLHPNSISSGESTPRFGSPRSSRKSTAEPLDVHPSLLDPSSKDLVAAVRSKARRGSTGSRGSSITPSASPVESRERSSRTPSLDSQPHSPGHGPLVSFPAAAANGMLNTGSLRSFDP